MIYVDSSNLLNTKATHVTLNGSYVYATIQGKRTDIRTIAQSNWYDDKHTKVVKAINDLEKALREILE